MKVKVGIDLVEIDRMQTALQSSERFFQKVFGEQERSYYESHGMRTESLAAAFAAKEAFSKALGTGVRDFALREVEVVHDELGCPHYALSGQAKEIADEQGLSFELSLTHTNTTAAAVAVAIKED